MPPSRPFPKFLKDGVEPAFMGREDAEKYLGSPKLVCRLLFAARHYPERGWIDLVGQDTRKKNSKVLISTASIYRAVERMIAGEEPPEIVAIKDVCRAEILTLSVSLARIGQGLTARDADGNPPSIFAIDRGRTGETRTDVTAEGWSNVAREMDEIARKLVILSEDLNVAITDGPEGIPKGFCPVLDEKNMEGRDRIG